MTKARWHIVRDGKVLTLARRLPARFDVQVATQLPDGARLRVAQQIRQDIWRKLQNLRGFSPVVQVTRSGGGLNILAGGQIDGNFDARFVAAQIQTVLDDVSNRTRWIKCAA